MLVFRGVIQNSGCSKGIAAICPELSTNAAIAWWLKNGFYHPITYTIHGTGILTYIWLMLMVNVGKYTIHTWILWVSNQ